MNKWQVQCIDRAIRLNQFVTDHQITPAIPRATTLLTEMNTLREDMLEYGSDQEGGLNTYRSGATQRRELRNAILFIVREISDTAKGLDPAQHPGISDLFRLNEARVSYQRLINTGASFVDHLAAPAVKVLFTDRGFPSNFDTELTAKLNAFAAATGIKCQGRQTQKAGTVGLYELNRRITVVIRELRVIVLKYLRSTNPLLVPVFEAAARIYTPAVNAPATPAEESNSAASNDLAGNPSLRRTTEKLNHGGHGEHGECDAPARHQSANSLASASKPSIKGNYEGREEREGFPERTNFANSGTAELEGVLAAEKTSRPS